MKSNPSDDGTPITLVKMRAGQELHVVCRATKVCYPNYDEQAHSEAALY
jgi:hypothetical protein